MFVKIVTSADFVKSMLAADYIPAGELSRKRIRLASVDRTIARMKAERKRLLKRIKALQDKVDGNL